MAGSTFQPPINLDPNQDHSQQIAFINQNFQSLAASLNPFIVSDGTNNRIILGKQNDGTYGMKVSQSGVDVGTATNSQLIFNSSQNVFKIIIKNTSTIPSFSIATSSGFSFVTIAHGQSFTPLVQVYVRASLLNWGTGTLVTSNYVALPVVGGTTSTYLFQDSGGSYRNLNIVAIADSTNIYIQATCPTTSAATTMNSIPVTYFVLQETAA